MSGAQTRARFTRMSGNINRRLDGTRHTMQRPQFVSAQNRFLRLTRLRNHGFRLVDHKWTREFRRFVFDMYS